MPSYIRFNDLPEWAREEIIFNSSANSALSIYLFGVMLSGSKGKYVFNGMSVLLEGEEEPKEDETISFFRLSNWAKWVVFLHIMTLSSDHVQMSLDEQILQIHLDNFSFNGKKIVLF